MTEITLPYRPGDEVAVQWFTGAMIVVEARVSEFGVNYRLEQSGREVGWFEAEEMYVPKEWV